MIFSMLRGTKGVVVVPRSLVSWLRNVHSNARISASPRVALNDVIPRIQVQGLTPKSAITLRAQMFDQKGIEYLSNAHYVTDEDGSVDAMTSASVGGSYEGIFPTGLISSLQIADAKFRYRRVAYTDVTQPLHIKISLFEGLEPLHTNQSSLDHTNLERHFLSPGVRRIQVRDGRVRGVLFIPAGEGVFPGVVEMNGAIGILVESRGALLASRGIACLCLAYFRYDDIPISKLHSQDIEYFEEATEYLTSQDNVITDRCGVLGTCYGGTLGSIMVVHIDKVKAMFGINFHTRHVGIFSRKGEDMFNKNVKPYIPPAEEFYDLIKGNTELSKPSYTFIRNLTCPKGTFLPYLSNVSKEKYFSFAFGEDDSYKTIKCIKGIKEAVGKDLETNFEIKTYPSAGHLIEPPYAIPAHESFVRIYDEKSEKERTFQIIMGGTPKATSEMQQDVWQNIQKFFNYHIRDNSLCYQNLFRNPKKK